MVKNVTRNIVIAIATGLTVSLAVAAASANSQSATVDTALKVLSSDGRYLELDPASGQSVASGRYEDPDGPQIEDVISKGDRPLYALLGVGELPDENGEMRFRIAALDRHTLKVLHSYDLPQPQIAFPELLMDPNGSQLLVLTQAGIQTLAIRADGNIAPMGPMAKAPSPLPTLNAYIDTHGKIVVGESVYDRKGLLIREVRPESVFDAALRVKFAPVTLIKGTTDHYYGAILSASAGDRIVFTVGWDQEDRRIPQAGVAVYDLNAGRVISSFFSEFPVEPLEGPEIRLSPDGRRIVIEQYQWLPRFEHPRGALEAASKLSFGTGKLAIYDADTGNLTGTVDLGPASDPRAGTRTRERVVGYSRDASRMYYWFDQHLAVIDLGNAKLVSKTALPAGYDPVAVVGSH